MKMSSKAILGLAVCSALGLASTAEASLIIDLRAVSASSANTTIANAGKTVSITSSSLNDTVTFDVFAEILGPGGTGGVYGLTSAWGAFVVPGNTSTTKGTFDDNGAALVANASLTGVGITPWNANGSQVGLKQDIYGNGNTDLGQDATVGAVVSANFVAMIASAIQTSGWNAISGGVEQKIGSVTFKVTTVGANGTDTPVNFLPRTNSSGGALNTAALWKEDTNSSRNPTLASYAAGTAVQIHVGGVVVTNDTVQLASTSSGAVQVTEGSGPFDNNYPTGPGAPPNPVAVGTAGTGSASGSLAINDLVSTGDVYVLVHLTGGKTLANLTHLPGGVTAVDLTSSSFLNANVDWKGLMNAYGNFANVGFKFSNAPGGTANNFFQWDLSADSAAIDQIVAVPEPASLGLAAFGGLALLMRRRRSAK